MNKVLEAIKNENGRFYGYVSEDGKAVDIVGVGRIMIDGDDAVMVLGEEHAPVQGESAILDLRFCEHFNRGGRSAAFYVGNNHFVCQQCALRVRKKLSKRVDQLAHIVGVVYHGRRGRLRSGPNSWGIELEIANLSESLRYEGYHARYFAHAPILYDWRSEYDRSIEDDDGIELISPVLGEWRTALPQLHYTLDMALRNGGDITRRCGTHVHVGGFLNSLVPFSQIEEGVFAIASNMHRYATWRYAPPIKSGRTEGHYAAFVLHPGRGTIEWRLFPGSLDFTRQLMNVALARAVTRLAMQDKLRVAIYMPNTTEAILEERNGVIRYSSYAKVADVAVAVARKLLHVLGWYPGGDWKGWPMRLGSKPMLMSYEAWDGKKTIVNKYRFPTDAEVLSMIEENINAFVKAARNRVIRG